MGNCNSNVDSIHPNDTITSLSLPLNKHNIQQSKAITKSIDAMLQHDYNIERAVIKCLLLGAGECGKSTILKQMKILHLNGFSNEEKLNYRSLIWYVFFFPNYLFKHHTIFLTHTHIYISIKKIHDFIII